MEILTADNLIRMMEKLTPEQRKLPLFTYNSKYSMWFPLSMLDIDMDEDNIWHHINQIGDLYEWSEDTFHKNDVLVKCLKLL